jgi:hypothetical protein
MSEWQALAPVAAWRQWALKCAVLFGWVVLLDLVIRGMIVHCGPWNYSLAEVFGAARWFAPFMVMMVAACLYVSSLRGTTIQAVLISLPARGGMLRAATLMNFRLDRNFDKPRVRNFDQIHAVLAPPLTVIAFFCCYCCGSREKTIFPPSVECPELRARSDGRLARLFWRRWWRWRPGSPIISF